MKYRSTRNKSHKTHASTEQRNESSIAVLHLELNITVGSYRILKNN